MAREVTGAREQLAVLNEKFPDKEMLTKKDIYGFLGISRNTLRKHFPELWEKPFTNKADLAKILARQSVA